MESNLLKYFELGETELGEFKKNKNLSLLNPHCWNTAMRWPSLLSNKTFLIIPSRHAPLQTECHFFFSKDPLSPKFLRHYNQCPESGLKNMKLVPNNTLPLRAPRSNSWIMHRPQISGVSPPFFLVSVWSREQKGGQSDGRTEEENGNWVLSGRVGLNTHTNRRALTRNRSTFFQSGRLIYRFWWRQLDWTDPSGSRVSAGVISEHNYWGIVQSLSQHTHTHAQWWIKYTLLDIFHNTDQRPHFWLIYLPQVGTFVLFKGLFLAHEAARKQRERFIKWRVENIYIFF